MPIGKPPPLNLIGVSNVAICICLKLFIKFTMYLAYLVISSRNVLKKDLVLILGRITFMVYDGSS